MRVKGLGWTDANPRPTRDLHVLRLAVDGAPDEAAEHVEVAVEVAW